MSLPAGAPASRHALPRWPVHVGAEAPLRRHAAALVALLLALDFMLISADVLRHRGVLEDARFAITRERSFGEMFQYAKFAAMILLLLTARCRSTGALLWSALFALLLVDDSYAVHEQLGLSLATSLGLPGMGPLRPVDLAELIVFAGAAVAVLVPLAFMVWRGDAASRALTLALVPPLALLGTFAVGADVVHSLSRWQSFRYLTGLIEDGGELVATTLLLAVCYFENRRGSRALR